MVGDGIGAGMVGVTFISTFQMGVILSSDASALASAFFAFGRTTETEGVSSELVVLTVAVAVAVAIGHAIESASVEDMIEMSFGSFRPYNFSKDDCAASVNGWSGCFNVS